MAKPATITIEMSSFEAHAYDFFRFHTVNQLPGSSWTLSWERLALQAGHHEPAVTHAAIALGSLHRAITAQQHLVHGRVDPDQRHFALSQYNKAMGYIRRYIDSLGKDCTDVNVEVVLLVSLLFFCFEILHGEDARATLHLRTGLRILYERIRRMDIYRSPNKMMDLEGEEKRVVRVQTRPRTNMDVLIQTFIRLDGDLTVIGDEEPYLYPVCHETIPTSFHSLEEAMVHLDIIAHASHLLCRDFVILADQMLDEERPEVKEMDEDMRNCLACAASRTIPIPPEQELRLANLKRDMDAWMSALAFLPVAEQKQSAHLLTHIHFFYTWFIILTWRDENEMAIDRFDRQFEHILSLTEQYVDMHGDVPSSAPTSSPDGRPGPPVLTRQAFTVGTDVVPCITMIGVKSRNSAIRRRCIHLLRLINLSGVFDGYYLASFVQAVVDLEETRARALTGMPDGVDLKCEDVPEPARFIEIELSPFNWKDQEHDFYKKDTGRLVYVSLADGRKLQVDETGFYVDRPAGATGALPPHPSNNRSRPHLLLPPFDYSY
jgi:hypothetical protein